MPASASALPDAKARERIVGDTDANFVVEAAAGSGKTTCLVERLLTLAREGRIAPDRLVAAVTFTRKAAAELRDRLQARVDAERDQAAGALRERLDAAARALRQCHMGTIHSFCGRLLRERPVEAGVDPDFAELDGEADALLLDRAWDEFAARFPEAADADFAEAFFRLDLSLEDLRDGFALYCQYPDVQAWPGEDADSGLPGAEALLARALAFAASVVPYLALAETVVSPDALFETYQTIGAWAARQAGAGDIGSLVTLLDILPESPAATQKCWKPVFGAAVKTDLEAEKERYQAFYAAMLTPLRASRYAAALRCFRRAAVIYDRLRRDAGGLNFRDLLLKTARLLRDYPEARADLSRRYARLLVDEVQDTDPIQAEILFLLAGDDPAEKDWRRCRLRPGSLFMVGDPKQSIYRFTRADIATYALIKRLVVANGGEVLGLSVNFRSQPVVVDWVNRTFAPTGAGSPYSFPEEESDASPAYVPLHAGVAEAGTGCFTGVYLLELLKRQARRGNDASLLAVRGKAEILADEADRIAAFIRHALDKPLLLPGRDGSATPAGPGDFLVATRRRDGVGTIAAALQRAGVPTRLSGVNDFAAEGPVRLLAVALAAVLRPDDQIAQIACIRSRLMGVSDADLYRWKKAGGCFNRLAARPAAGPETVGNALNALDRFGRLFRDNSPLTALAALADALGLWLLAAGEGDGDAGAGTLASVLNRLAAEEGETTTPDKVLERLRRLVDGGELDILPALGDAGDAVRLMNVHKAKGLEAPVVFLAGMPDDRSRKCRIAIDRSGERVEGWLGLYRGGGRVPNGQLIACPAEWRDRVRLEQAYLDAEKIRLSYVAATRAGAAVVVSALPQSAGLKSAMIHTLDIDERLPEDFPAAAPPSEEAEAFEPEDECDRDGAGEAARRIGLLLAPTYALSRAKSPGHGPSPVFGGGDFGDGGPVAAAADSETAMAIGEILHELLEYPAADAAAGLRGAIADKLAERDLPAGLAEGIEEMVTGAKASDLWRRAGKAKRAFRELPFVMAARDGGGLPALVRGVIDLAFEEDDGWVIADYKSDNPRGRPLSELAERHRGQLEAYAEALLGADPGGRVKEMGIYFLRAGAYVMLDADATCG